MRAAALDEAIAEARRFLERASAVKQALRTDEHLSSHPKETGALRRSSMDLTRALADLRRP